MAKVFSWKVIEGYAYIAHPKFVKDNSYPEKVCVTNKELSTDEVCLISDWAYDCSFKDFEEHFDLMVAKCSSKNHFLTAREYWDTPQVCNLKGPKGDQGLRGLAGEKGEKGDPGPRGPVGPTPIPAKTYFAFKTSEEEPPRPEGGFWDPFNNTFVYPEGWSASDKLDKPVWMSMKTFSQNEEIEDDWSIPMNISGADGKNGADGVTTEFIYKRTKNDIIGSKPDTSKLPSLNVNDYVPKEYGWTDSPQGVDEKDYQAEWVTSRKKDTKTGKWGAWKDASLWSKYGANGMDGDGIQYIFYLSNGLVPSNPTPENIDTDEYQEKGEYKDIEYCPTELGWTDNPTGVDIKHQFEWSCIRKFRNGKWEKYSNPSLWAKFGENGSNGYSTLSLYAMTDVTSEAPAFIKDAKPSEQLNIWSKNWPVGYHKGNAVWEIVATIVTREDKLVEGTEWEGPILKTGLNGKDATLPNYSTDVFAMSESKPEPPTSEDPKFPGTSKNKDGETVTWIDFPNTEGTWWKCVGKVNGLTDKMMIEGGKPAWGSVLPHTGAQGPGIFPEFRCAKGTINSYPEIEQVRNPKGWTTSDVYVPELKKPTDIMWEISAMISYKKVNGELVGTIIKQKNGKYWQGPRRINGEQGIQGETGPVGPPGPIGVSGVPGVGFKMRFCLGTLDDYDGAHPPVGINPEGWFKERPEITELRPYIWAVQGEEVFEIDKNPKDPMNPYKLVDMRWDDPYRPDGINGLDGRDGNKGQIVYPAGAYNKDKIYTCTDQSAPYVLDGDSFYLMNFIGNWQGSVQKESPSESAAKSNEFWVPFNSVDAIYAKVGIIPNGLIGEFVFNKQFVFSQLGIYYPDPKHPETNYPASNYATYRSNGSEEIVAPETIYDDIEKGIFVPYILMNAMTGEAWFAGKEIHFTSDGTVEWKRMTDAESSISETDRKLGLQIAKLDQWAEDGFISPTEMTGIKEEKSRVEQENKQINEDFKSYNLGKPEDLNNAYGLYINDLNAIINGKPNENKCVAVPLTFIERRNSYYVQRTLSYNYLNLQAKQYVDSIEIGGTNIVKNSDEPSKETDKVYTLTKKWKELSEKEICISFDYEYLNVSTNDIKYRIGLEAIIEGGKKVECWNELDKNATSLKGSGRTYTVLTVPSNTSENDTITVKIEVLSGTVEIDFIEIELGNKPTTWSPAPEDIKDGINSASKSAKEANDKLAKWAEDGIISPTELNGIINEYNRIESDYFDMAGMYEGYALKPDIITYKQKENYSNVLNSIITGEKDSDGCYIIKDISSYNTARTEYYTWEKEILGRIETASKDKRLSVDTSLQEAHDEAGEADKKAKDAQSAADAANNKLKDWALDSVISPTEMAGVIDEKNKVLSDISYIEGSYTDFQEKHPDTKLPENWTKYSDAYVADLSTIINKTGINEQGSVPIPETFSTSQANYYSVRTEALQNLAIATKAFADAASASAETANKNAGNAQSAADAANNKLKDWALDSVISPTEMKGVIDEKNKVDYDIVYVESSNKRYELTEISNWTKYSDAYVADLNAIINGKANEQGSIPIPETFESNQINYYKVRTASMEAISLASKKYVDDVEIGGTNLVSNNPENWAEYTTIDSPTIGMTWEQIMAPSSKRFTSKELYPCSSNKITVNMFSNDYQVMIYFFDSEKKYISDTGNYIENYPSTIKTNGAQYFGVLLGRKNYGENRQFDDVFNAKLKIEKGDKATDWSISEEDNAAGTQNLLLKSNEELYSKLYLTGSYNYAVLPKENSVYSLTVCYDLAEGTNLGVYWDGGYASANTFTKKGTSVIAYYTGVFRQDNRTSKNAITFYTLPDGSNFDTTKIHWATLVEGYHPMKTWMKSIKEVEDEISGIVLPDIDYITETFKKYKYTETITKPGVILSNFIGVKDNSSLDTKDNVRAFMNGSSAYGDDIHGTMMFASGMKSMSNDEELYPWHCSDLNGTTAEEYIYTELDFGAERPDGEIEGGYGGQNDFRYYAKNGQNNTLTVPYGNFSLFTRKYPDAKEFEVVEYAPYGVAGECINFNAFPFNSYLFQSICSDYTDEPYNILDLNESQSKHYITDSKDDVFIAIGTETIDNVQRLCIYKTDITLSETNYDAEARFYFVDKYKYKGKTYDRWLFNDGTDHLDDNKEPIEYYVLTLQIVKDINLIQKLEPNKIFLNMNYLGNLVLNPLSPAANTGSSVPNPDDPADKYPNYCQINKNYIYKYEIKREYWKDGIEHILYYKRTNSIAKEKVKGYELAPTKIFEDGTILTDKLMTKQGSFKGEIDAKGTFSGTLVDVTGSIKNVNIYDSIYNGSIDISKDQVFRVIGDKSTTLVNIANKKLSQSGSNEIVPFKSFGWNRQNKNGSNSGIDYGGNELLSSFYAVAGAEITLPTISIHSYIYTADKNDTIYSPICSVKLKYKEDTNGIVSQTKTFDTSTYGREYINMTTTLSQTKKNKKAIFDDKINYKKITAPVTGYYRLEFEWHLHLNKYTWLQADLSYGEISATGYDNIYITYKDMPKMFSIGNNGFKFSNGNGTIVSMIDDKIDLIVNDKYGIRITSSGITKIIDGTSTSL